MHPSNIMWYLKDLTVNSNAEVKVGRYKYYDDICIITDTFYFYIDEDGEHQCKFGVEWSDVYNDIELWELVKDWVKQYMNEVL